MQYVGETKNAIKERFRAHFWDITREEDAEHPVGMHFNRPGHVLASVTIQVIDFWRGDPNLKKTTDSRRVREHDWIHILRTYHPYGMNERA